MYEYPHDDSRDRYLYLPVPIHYTDTLTRSYTRWPDAWRRRRRRRCIPARMRQAHVLVVESKIFSRSSCLWSCETPRSSNSITLIANPTLIFIIIYLLAFLLTSIYFFFLHFFAFSYALWRVAIAITITTTTAAIYSTRTRIVVSSRDERIIVTLFDLIVYLRYLLVLCEYRVLNYSY